MRKSRYCAYTKRCHTLKKNTLQKFNLLILLLIIGLSCQEKQEYPTDLKPTYTDFENSWDERNLFGKVKDIEWYKTVFQNSDNEGKSNLNLIETFTEFGSLKENSNYGSDGELIQKDIYEYDNQKSHIKTISKNIPAKINYILTVKDDTINKTRTTKVIVNDTFNKQVKIFYDNKDIPSRKIEIEQKDTTNIKFQYNFNDGNKKLAELQIDQNTNDTIYSSKNTYDQKGNLILSSYKLYGSEYITETEWKKGHIKKQTDYTILPDLTKNLNEVIEYDDLFNPINSKIYENSKINRELKYEYEFDDKGNWIKREVSMKENFTGSKKYKPIYVETRKIKYWE